MKILYVSSPRMTGCVDVTDSDIIIKTPPVWRKFTGKHLKDLTNWLNKHGKVTVEVMEIWR